MAKLLSGLIATVLLAIVPCPVSAQEATTRNVAIVLNIDGAIGPATAEYVHDGFAEAAQRQAEVVVLRLDTPGGLSSSMREIIRDILASQIPVISYVSPTGARAASAGTYIVYASHLAAMAPSTHLGAATPVQIGGGLFGGGKNDEKNKEGKTPANPEEAKVLNDAVAYIRSLAQLRGRNAEWAEKAVREAATLTDTEAIDNHVADFIASDLPDLLRKADGRTVKIGNRDVTLKTRGLAVVTFAPNWRTRLLATITNPNIAYLLLLAGIYGIMFEFFSPGAYFPGVLGSIALLVGLYALNLLPINYAGVGLLLLGVALMVAEAFLPSFGVIGIGGIAAFTIGSLLLFRGDVPGFQLSWSVVATATLVSVGFLMIALAAVWRAHRRRVVIGDAALLGSAAQVVSWGDDDGEVHVGGELWHAKSTAPLAPGQRVRIVGRRGLTLFIEPDPTGPPKH
jgi:membrane-bound serine protease (ClpP class)